MRILLVAASLLAAQAPPASPMRVSIDAGKGVLVAGQPCRIRVTFTNDSAERAKLDASLVAGAGLHLQAVEPSPGAAEKPESMRVDLGVAPSPDAAPYEISPGGALTASVDVTAFTALGGKCDSADVWFESGGLKSAPVRVELVEDLTKTLVVLETNKGAIRCKVDPVNAPLASRNFVRHVAKGTYDGTQFHRVIKNFMAQGGDPNSRDTDPTNDGGGGAPYNGRPLRAELSSVLHERGVLSMARNGDPSASPQLQSRTVQMLLQLEGKNPNDGAAVSARYEQLTREGFFRDRQPFLDSAGTQFFLCFARVAHLDGNYTSFGRMVSGDEVLKAFESVPTTPGTDRPVEPLRIEKARLEPAK